MIFNILLFLCKILLAIPKMKTKMQFAQKRLLCCKSETTILIDADDGDESSDRILRWKYYFNTPIANVGGKRNIVQTQINGKMLKTATFVSNWSSLFYNPCCCCRARKWKRGCCRWVEHRRRWCHWRARVVEKSSRQPTSWRHRFQLVTFLT